MRIKQLYQSETLQSLGRIMEVGARWWGVERGDLAPKERRQREQMAHSKELAMKKEKDTQQFE